MPIGGFYRVRNPMNTAMQGMANAANSYASMDKGGKTETEEAAKTAGGALMSGAGGAAAGAAVGGSLAGSTIGGAKIGSSAGPYGAAIGAAVGLLGYLLS